MDEDVKVSRLTAEIVLQPLIKRTDLGRTWIGLGAAIEWIAMRGQPIPESEYRDREDTAANELVAELEDLPAEIAESLVRGVPEETNGPLVSIPSGIWRQTATSDANEVDQPCRLIGTDYDREFDGAILSVHLPSYRRVQIQSKFILDRWPEHTRDIQVSVKRKAVALAEVRRQIERVIASADIDLKPLTHREMFQLVNRIIPDSTRDMVQNLYRELGAPEKSGPRGSRDPERSSRIQKLGEKLIADQLLN